ncbi:MAG: hypothetical protein AAF773_17350, partial [Cyanobacteria bacterium P01_D01_bin.115]
MASTSYDNTSVNTHETALVQEHLSAGTLINHQLRVTETAQEILSQVIENKDVETALNQVFSGTLVDKGKTFFESLV